MSTPQPEPGGDPRAEKLMKAVLECLCTTLAEAGRAACCCMWRRVDRLLMPQACDCKCPEGEGVAWARIIERRYDRQVTRSPGFDGKTCGFKYVEEWGVEVGVARCWPGGENGLECEQETAVAADGAWDEDLIMQAMLCCKPLEKYAILPVRATTLGPQGGCIAAVATFIVQPGKRPAGGYGY